jgi:hypothetical protein
MEGILTPRIGGVLIKGNVEFRRPSDHLQTMDILLTGGAVAISAVATLYTGKFMLRGFVAVLERRSRT